MPTSASTFASIGSSGWEATPGRFHTDALGRLRYVRVLRRIGDTLAYLLDADTPALMARKVAALLPIREAA